jgi:Holliday junction resolvase RusA-like endonuclease
MIDQHLSITPVPKGRPRATKTGRIYTPSKTADYERAISKMMSHHPAYLGPLALDVTFVLKRPVNTPKSKPHRFFKAGSRGDLDNYVKSLLDGLQRSGVVPNDAAVVQIVASKVYAAIDEASHIELKLWSLDQDQPSTISKERQIARARESRRSSHEHDQV